MRKSERNAHKLTGSRGALRNLARSIGLALLIASIVRELRLPKEKRTWQGVVLGRIPYDLRPPSLARMKTVVWNPENPRIVVPTAFGVGWTVNLAALRNRLPGAMSA